MISQVIVQVYFLWVYSLFSYSVGGEKKKKATFLAWVREMVEMSED